MFFNKSVDKGAKPSGNKAVFWGASDRMICCKGIAGDGSEFNVTSHSKLDVKYSVIRRTAREYMSMVILALPWRCNALPCCWYSKSNFFCCALFMRLFV